MPAELVDSPRVIRSRRVVLPDGVRPASIHIGNGLIERIGSHDDTHGVQPGSIRDVGDLVVMAGLVDTHVHVNEPGRTEWEGFATATRAAAAGGVTTLLDMPLNAIPATTTVAALIAKRASTRGQCMIDVGFIGGVVPGNAGNLASLRSAGVLAFKCFLAPSGVEEFPHVGESDLRIAFPVLASLGAVLMVHAEDPACLTGRPEGGDVGYAAYLASRPAAAEVAAIEMLVRLVERWPTPVHVVHLTSADGLAVVRDARRRGLPITAETCPHYLTFSADEVPAGATEYKCAPPIREGAHRDALWGGLADGSIGMVVFGAWGGIASLQLGLPAVWTAGAGRGLDVDRIARLMCEAPAALVGLNRRKGRLAAGYDADIVVWDPESTLLVVSEGLQHRHPVTPYAGRTLHGVVRSTYSRGRLVHHDGVITGAPMGELLANT
jgi:allantoinase